MKKKRYPLLLVVENEKNPDEWEEVSFFGSVNEMIDYICDYRSIKSNKGKVISMYTRVF